MRDLPVGGIGGNPDVAGWRRGEDATVNLTQEAEVYGGYDGHMAGWGWALMALEIVLLVALVSLAAYVGASPAGRDRRRASH